MLWRRSGWPRRTAAEQACIFGFLLRAGKLNPAAETIWYKVLYGTCQLAALQTRH
jgi:hypothetical protein